MATAEFVEKFDTVLENFSTGMHVSPGRHCFAHLVINSPDKHTGLLFFFFFTFPSSGILETRKHDVSETGSVSVLRS
jgi:hypothetical protein